MLTSSATFRKGAYAGTECGFYRISYGLLPRARDARSRFGTGHMRCGAPKPITQYRRVCVLLRSATYNRMYRDMRRIAAIMQP